MNRLILLSLAAATMCACTASHAEDKSADKAKDARIETGVQLTHALAALYGQYKSGLNDMALVAYFNDPANEEKFEAFWKVLAKEWFSRRVQPCRYFSHWDQFREERLWVTVANAYLLFEDRGSLGDSELSDLFGAGWQGLRDLGPNEVLGAPVSPRVLNAEALERNKAHFADLFRNYRLDAAVDTATQLRRAVSADLNDRLIFHKSGLRKKIFLEYKNDFVAELDKLREKSGLMEYMIIEVPNETLVGFDAADLTVVSPVPKATTLKIKVPSETSQMGDVEVGRDSAVGDTPAYSFKLELGPTESVRLWLKAP